MQKNYIPVNIKIFKNSLLNKRYYFKFFDFLSVFILIQFFILVIFFSLSGGVPLTYDEAWNFLWLSKSSPFSTLVSYPAPNNHILFTFLQSLLIPNILVKLNPHFLRTLNIIYLMCSAVISFYLFNKNKKISLSAFVFLFISMVFISPLFTMYLFVARGYLFGTLLLFFGCFFLAFPLKNCSFLGWLLLIFACWTLPTFAYCLPGIFVLYFLFIYQKNGKKFHILKNPITLTIFILFCLYLPVIGKMMEFTGSGNQSFMSFISYSFNMVSSLSNFDGGDFRLYSMLTVLVIGIIVFLIQLLKLIKKRSKTNEQLSWSIFSLYLMGCVISFILSVIILNIISIASFPFLRNYLFVPLFSVFSIFLFFWTDQKKVFFIITLILILVNSLFGIKNFYLHFIDGNPNNYSEEFERLTPSPLSMFDIYRRSGIKMIEYKGYSEVVSSLYSYSYDIPIESDDLENKITCDIGTYVPPLDQRVSIVLNNGQELILCY